MTSLTLADIAKTPEQFTFRVQLGEGFVLRPLLPDGLLGEIPLSVPTLTPDAEASVYHFQAT